MFDPKEYCEVCRELRAPEKKIEEIIAMTEHRTPKKWVRSLGAGLTACAAAATMVVGVAAANPEAAQEFFAHITSAVKVDEFRRDLTTKDGEQVTVLDLPQATVENQNGRAILVVNGEETDITDQLKAAGSYTRELSFGGTQVTVTVEGSATEWMLTTAFETLDGGLQTFTIDSKGSSMTAPSRYSGRGYRDLRTKVRRSFTALNLRVVSSRHTTCAFLGGGNEAGGCIFPAEPL